MKTLLIIPAHNEAGSLKRVVDEIRCNYAQFDYVVVNDGSTDDTAAICRAEGYRFLDLPINLGLSGAFQTGIKYALHQGYDCAIQYDADGQHRPEYLESMVEALHTCNIVIGSRFLEGSKPQGMRAIGSTVLEKIFRMTTGTEVTDPTSGMRAYDRHALELLAAGPNLGPEPDTLAFLIRKKGLTVKEVPVKMGIRLAGESYLTAGVSVFYMMRMVVSMLVFHHFR